ncbi:MAG: BMP family ABC transporter substrate-binding protein [Gemmiger sp.]|uniref:BMP family ABC transporter substrate-binding protein n=1 Tax=Gemmiger sp. TaxID=2049027 RepID=UPI002E77F75C|nr:BMP family ABC transporter substrate-binding protein [Gemmiger sp.]MEE0800884.1 BMP family ABC transporter substrate-binding protein [Gemmiger sp.]
MDALTEYSRAQKLGQRDYREKVMAGQYPYLPALDDMTDKLNVEAQLPLGTVEIPLELVAGTKTAGRTAAFASNFMPLLPEKSEFANKWVSLCLAHLEEGIHDPIRCFEYLGRFYVQEGNKRVSVLKYFGADSISANVTRMVPQYTDTPQIRLYYEFMEFYPLCRLYSLKFTQEGSFARLQKALGMAPGEKWDDDVRADVLSLLNWVKKAYYAHGGDRMHTTPADVLLLLLRVYKRDELKNYSPAELAKAIDAVWDDVLAIERPEPVKLSTQPPAPAEKSGLLDRILTGKRNAPEHLKVAFVNERTPETSTWTSLHEFGRTQLDMVFAGQVETVAYHGAEAGRNADELVEKAITDGADIVFTTSPKLVGASLRAALRHPEVRILNCSVDMPYASIRTYYTRVYEAKFITGAIAGAFAQGDRIGYVADTPTFGVPANINAFALGARMVNPRIKVDLRWTSLDDDPVRSFAEQGITVVSGRDAPAPGRPAREFGTFQIRPGGMLADLASPFWHWGQFYENVIRTVLNGGWTRDKSGVDGRAVNYWWGMNSGVMDVLFSRELPHDVRHLADILRSGIISGSIDPFACHIVAQDGTLMNEGRTGFSPEQILHMDWLCDAVEGHIPEFDELKEIAKPMYRMQGIHRDRLPAEKEAEL